MKLKAIDINSYRHLHKIKFDFTYPEGHARSGEPLDKICIIGQSATGKTSVLEAIKNNVIRLNSAKILDEKYLWPEPGSSFDGKFEYTTGQENIETTTDSISIGSRTFSKIIPLIGSGMLSSLGITDLKLLYLSSDIISREAIEIFNQNPLQILEKVSHEQRSEYLRRRQESSYVYEFFQSLHADSWYYLLYDILDYRKRFTQMASEVINRGALADVNRLAKQFSQWAESNNNPLEPFAEKFNPILRRLNLEVDLINTEYIVPIKTKNKDEILPISELSTGTKGLLLTLFPLFELNTEGAIVLIDEPERSLFPDIQIELITHYQSLAPGAQFIVATHSPFIAAAFEPEERFILYFTDQGEVCVRRGSSPIGDDPNDILRNDFDVDYYNEFGKQAYQKYLTLKTRVAGETDNTKKKELVREMAKLGDKYNF